MILLCGIPSEPPLALVRDRLTELGASYTMFNQRRIADAEMAVDIEAGRVTGRLTLGDISLRLDEIESVYLRLMDHRMLPEVEGAPPNSKQALHSERVHDLFLQWCGVTEARVVNRIGPMSSNGSKPYQSQLIAKHGFAVPETLVTNDPKLVLDFFHYHHRVIYKSISGVRSIVQRLRERDLDRLEQIRWCPVQFQALIEGQDIRVHCVGGEIFATAVESQATDYRYALQQSSTPAVLSPIALDDDVAQRCLDLAAGLGLAFAGIDLRLTPAGETFCFEVNPCPGYSYYEASTGQPISLAVARYLTMQAA